MERVLKMLRRSLRNQRIFRAEVELLKCQEKISDNDLKALTESSNELNETIPQLEKAIKVLTQWRDK